MSEAKARILARLRASPARPVPERPDWESPAYGAGRLAKFCRMLEDAHAEIHQVTPDDWPERLRSVLAAKSVGSLLYAPTTEAGRQLAAAWAGQEAPRLLAYDRPIEDMKPILVHEVEAGLTTAEGGIAETGSLVLWPGPAEPRLMSLLPPIHVVLVAADAIADSLAATIGSRGWAAAMPTNALLVSGPSKTADIEQTLAYGVHGPKELVVMIIGRS